MPAFVRGFLGVVLAATVVVISAAGCSRECPQVQCPVCEQQVAAPTPPPEQPPPPVEGVEQWVHLPFRITFATDDAALDEQQRVILREVVNTLNARRDVRRLRVEGHTDSRGREATNHQLSVDRATTVLEYLVTLGVPRENLEAVGHGASQPITSDTREMDRAQNRRVEFSVLVVVPHGQTAPQGF
jgi:outer membrane protein OmpA-like peptidoglycan-associated protein